MDINIDTSRTNQPTNVDRITVPKGATLLRNSYADTTESATGQPPKYNTTAYNPVLSTPTPVDKKVPVQTEGPPSEDQLAAEYEKAVLAGIKEKVADKAHAETMQRAFLTKDTAAAKSDTILAQIMQESQEHVNLYNKRAKDAPIPRPKEKLNEMGRAYKEAEVIKELKKYPELFNGEITNKGYQTLRNIMTGNTKGDPQAEAISTAANNYLGMDPGVDADAFNAKIGVEYEAAFQAQIAGLSPQEQKRMEYLFNMDPSNPEVKGFIDAANAQIEGKWGAGVVIVTENVTFNFQVNGEYQLSLDTTIKKLGPQLTQNEITAIKNYLIAKQNGQPSEISEPLKTIADKAHATALADVQLLYGVPKNWSPDTSINLHSILGTKQGQAYQALSDQLIATQARIDTLPPSPEKTKVAELLKIISQALTDLKQMLFSNAAADSSQSAELSRAQLSLIKDKADQAKAVQAAREKERVANENAAAKAKEQDDKSKIMGPVMIAVGAILTVLAVVVTAVSFGATAGLIALAIAVLIICLTYIPSGKTDEQGKSKSCMNALFEGVNQAIDFIATGGTDNPQLKASIGTSIRVVLILGAIIGGCASGQMTLLAPLIVTFITESGFIQKMMTDIVKATGAEEPPAWVATLVNAILVLTVVVAAVFAKSGNGQSFAKMDKALGLTKVSAGLKSLGGVAQGAQTMSSTSKMAIMMKATNVINTGLQVTSSVITAVGEFEMADLKKQIAKAIRETASAEAKMEEIEAMIKMLQKVIDAIYGQINEVTEWAKTTGQQMDQRWADKTELLSDLTS